jgi:hypothetical protein
MMVCVAVFAAALVAAGGLRIETATPAALCPDIGEVRRAVHDRLAIEGEGEWLASVDLVHRPRGEAADVVRVELRDPEGHRRLQRELPRSGESCVALAQAVALVLESFFRHPSEQPLDLRSAEPPVVARAAPVPPAAHGWGPALDLFGAWAVGPTGPALAVDLWYGSRSSWWAVGVEGVWFATEQELGVPYAGGDAMATVRSALLRGWVARRLRPAAAIEILVGPELALGLDRMQTDAALGGMSNVRGAGGGGARADLRLRLAARSTVSFLTAFDVTPHAWAGQFTLTGLTGELAPAPNFRLFVGVGLGFTLFR